MTLNLYEVVNNDNRVSAHTVAISHRRVTLVGSNQYLLNINNTGKQANEKTSLICPCCGKSSQDQINIHFDEDSIGFMGAGYPLYFMFNRLCWTLLLALCTILKFNRQIYKFTFKKRLHTLSESDFLSVLLFFSFLFIAFVYGWYMSWKNIVIDQNDTSPEDYSILVSNIPVSITTVPGLQLETQIKKFFEQNYQCEEKPLKVAEVCIFYNIDPLNKLHKKRGEHIERMKRVVKRRNVTTHEKITTEQEYYGVTSQTFSNVRKMDTEEMNRDILDRIDKLCDQGFVNNRVMFIGQAIVSFERQDMKQAVQQSGVAAYFFGNKLKMSKAQDPKNIFWYNLHLDGFDYRIRNVLSIVCCSCVLMVSLILQVLVTYIKVQISGTKYESRGFNYFTVIIVNIMNIVIPSVFLRFFSRFQGHRTHSEQMLSFSKKCILLQMMNTIVVPLMVHRLFKMAEASSFIQKQEGILVRNELFGFILTVVPFKLLMQHIKIYFTQRAIYLQGFVNKNITIMDLCKIYQHQEFDLEKKYCDLIKSMLLAFAFGAHLPKIILYAIVNIFLSGYIHRYYLVRFSMTKYNVSHLLNQQLFPLLFLAPALFLISQPVSPIKAVLFLVCMCLYFLPLISRIKKIANRAKDQKGKHYSYSKCKERKLFQSNYVEENPALNHKKKKIQE